MDKDKTEKVLAVIQAFQDFTDKLTLRRILTAVLAGIFGVLLYTTYEHRVSLLNYALGTAIVTSQDEDWDITESTAKDLTDLVNSGTIIKGVAVTQVDLRKNKRTPKFWHLDDPNVSQVKQKLANMLPTAVFDYDQKNTQQLVAVLNNEFVCSKTEDTVYARHFPELVKTMPYVCRIAVPPFYGRFVGLLTFGLRAEPSKSELDALKIEASRLSIQIYLRDVMHHKR